MPARSNAFQRFVTLVETGLAAHDATIRESVMLRDLMTGQTREIDVSVEVQAGPRRLRVALECRDQQRPADVQWIDELMGKYRHLPVDRVVAVSRSGFTGAAHARAALANIETIVPEQIPALDWVGEPCDGGAVAVLSPRYELIEIKLSQSPLTPESGQSSSTLAAVLIHRLGEEPVSLGQILHQAIADRNLALTKMWVERPGAEVVLLLPLPEWFFTDDSGHEVGLKGAAVTLAGQVDCLEFVLSRVAYAGEEVKHGETSLEGHPVSLVIVEPGREAERWLWYIEDSPTHPFRGSRVLFAGPSKPTQSFYVS